jgi:hypothetical protein
LLDGVFVWQIRVKTLGFGLWSEPVIGDVPYFHQCIIEVKILAPSAVLQVNPRSMDWMMAVHRRSSVVERCSSTLSTMVGPSDVGQRGLDDGRVTMDARGEVALYVTMGVDGRPGKVDVWIPILKMISRKMETGTSQSSHVLRDCWAGWCTQLVVGQLGEASSFTIMCVGVRSAQLAMFMDTFFMIL